MSHVQTCRASDIQFRQRGTTSVTEIASDVRSTSAAEAMPIDGTTRLDSLDGLRAVAVIAVVAFHAGLARVPGGFVGVDMFFVLSGFLITGLLLREHQGGGIDVIAFWFRRIRRLAPAALVTIVATGVLFSFVSAVPERASVLRDGRAATLWFANWHFVDEAQNYFRPNADASPFLHFWSLSIEEQFYVVWPLLVIAGLGLRRRVRWLVSPAVVIAAPVLAAAYTMVQSDRSPIRSYYATDTRVYQLLAGAALAVVLRRRGAGGSPAQQWQSWVAWAELAAVAGALAWVVNAADLSQHVRGLAATAITIVALLLLVPGSPLHIRGAPLERVTSFGPLVRIGRISYGVYLWHWPITVLLNRTYALGSSSKFVVVLGASIACASASWMFIELPIQRQAQRVRRRDLRLVAAVVGVAASVFVAVTVLPATLSDRVPLLRAAPRPGFASGPEVAGTSTPVPADLGIIPVELAVPNYDGCINRVPISAADCTAIDNGRAGPRVLVLGDSHAAGLAAAFVQSAFFGGGAVASVAAANCPWQSTVMLRNEGHPEWNSLCLDARRAVAEVVIPEFDPDVIVLIDRPLLEPDVLPDLLRTDGSPIATADAYRDASTEALAGLTAPGRRVVILMPTPSSPFDPQVCLASVTRVEDCTFPVTPVLHDELGALTAAATAASSVDAPVQTVSIVDLVCPRGSVCDPILGGMIVRIDPGHLYYGFIERIRPQLIVRVFPPA